MHEWINYSPARWRHPAARPKRNNKKLIKRKERGPQTTKLIDGVSVDANTRET